MNMDFKKAWTEALELVGDVELDPDLIQSFINEDEACEDAMEEENEEDSQMTRMR